MLKSRTKIHVYLRSWLNIVSGFIRKRVYFDNIVILTKNIVSLGYIIIICKVYEYKT